jgi:hypothetical protein
MAQDSSLDQETRRRLRDRAAAGPLPQVLVLPSQIRAGIGYYSELDLEAVKVLRVAGVEAAFLDSGRDRRFLGEYSADGMVQFALAVAQQLTVDGVAAVGRYLLGQLQSLHSRGLIHAPEATRVHVAVEQVEVRTQTSLVTVKGLQFEAVGRRAVSQVVRGLVDAQTARAALRELGLPENDEQD